MKVKTQVLDLILSVTLHGSGAAQRSLPPPQPRDKVQEHPGHPLHGNTLCIRGCPRAPGRSPAAMAQGSAQPPGAPVLPGQREHGPRHTQKQRLLVTSEHFAGASRGQSAHAILLPAPRAMHSNAAFPGIAGSRDPSEAHEHCSQGARGDPLSR